MEYTSSIWYEKYQPKSIDDIIIPKELKDRLKEGIANDSLPNIGLFSSNPGTGKSSTAKAILNELGCEAIWINASLERGVDVLRGKIADFASSDSLDGNLKFVVMDEFDHFTKDGQAAFRGFLDEFSLTCRFIFTGNYTSKIIKPLLDRLEVYDYNEFVKAEMIKPIALRLKEILDNENVSYVDKDLIPIINAFYPSIRSMVGAIQKYSTNKTLLYHDSDLKKETTFSKIVNDILSKNFRDMVQDINSLSSPDDFYSYLYDNLEKFENNIKPHVIMLSAKYQHMSSDIRDKHLNLASCCTELMSKIIQK